jgi:hypothetical protein
MKTNEEILKEYEKTFGEYCPISKRLTVPLKRLDFLRTALTQKDEAVMEMIEVSKPRCPEMSVISQIGMCRKDYEHLAVIQALDDLKLKLKGL